jgi:AcrR family transcriptional regulator
VTPKLIDHAERREHLATATWRVIRRDGVGGVSVRTVAAEAGLSNGSLRHVFGTQSELLVFALELVVDRVAARVAELPAQDSAVKMVEAVAAELIPLDHERRAEMEVYLALFTAANADADLRGPRDAAHQKMRDATRWMLDELAGRDALPVDTDLEVEAIRLHALLDGLAAHLVYEPPDANPEWARRVVVHHLRSLTVPS